MSFFTFSSRVREHGVLWGLRPLHFSRDVHFVFLGDISEGTRPEASSVSKSYESSINWGMRSFRRSMIGCCGLSHFSRSVEMQTCLSVSVLFQRLLCHSLRVDILPNSADISCLKFPKPNKLFMIQFYSFASLLFSSAERNR